VTFFTAGQARARLLGALAASATLVAAALVQATPAHAALSGTDWTEQTLPANYFVDDRPAPVSCVTGSRFCMAITYDLANIVNGSFIGQAALVSSDAGKTWTGHASLPSAISVSTVSCVSASVCWVAGPGPDDQPEVAESTNGGLTWTNKTPASWATATWWPNAMDCVTAQTCWLAGIDGEGEGLQDPAVAKTTDGGASWTTFTNLPTFASTDPNGTYALNGISCVSRRSCVAVGGLNESDGTATVISTTNGGATWTRSADPSLLDFEGLFGISCIRVAGGSQTCVAGAPGPAGPATIVSHDGGATWGDTQTFDDSGEFSSVSCVDVRHCWAAGAGTSAALVGTSDGGGSWSQVTSDTSDEYGSVSCLSVKVCVATIDNGLWVTSDDGGLQ
jgi:hypothetical protein